ncbi:MAG: hypothetical protein KC643_27380 [Nitrospira sp.]|nr:hypothetical protein [Nitrospira sp.]
MSGQTSRWQTPEEQELSKKQEELVSLQSLLAQRELDLITFQGELSAFEHRYLRIIGTRYAELDEVEAQIAETLSRSCPKNLEMKTRVSEARARANVSGEASQFDQDSIKQRERFTPSDELKKFFREAAKCIHPDLATDEVDRERRQRFMVKLNRAYNEGNEVRLREILREWESSPNAIKGEGVGPELIRIIRKISQIQKRLETIETAIARLQSSDLYRLKEEVDNAGTKGQNLLNEMASRLDQQIAAAKDHLAAL